jgi:hypothetical protein
MLVDTHLMALLSSLHGAILFFAGCFFGVRWARKNESAAPTTPTPAPTTEKGA